VVPLQLWKREGATVGEGELVLRKMHEGKGESVARAVTRSSESG